MTNKNTPRTQEKGGNVLRKVDAYDMQAVAARAAIRSSAQSAVDWSIWPRSPEMFAPAQVQVVDPAETAARAAAEATFMPNRFVDAAGNDVGPTEYQSTPEAINPDLAEAARAAISTVFDAGTQPLGEEQ